MGIRAGVPRLGAGAAGAGVSGAGAGAGARQRELGSSPLRSARRGCSAARPAPALCWQRGAERSPRTRPEPRGPGGELGAR